MSMFDVARYLSYSKSVDYFDGTIRSFNLQNVDCKKDLNNLFCGKKSSPIRFEKILETS